MTVVVVGCAVVAVVVVLRVVLATPVAVFGSALVAVSETPLVVVTGLVVVAETMM